MISRQILHPARVIPLTFLVAIGIGTLLLSLPAASESKEAVPFLVALFTATSAVCVTGLAVVDTPTTWSAFGEAVILLLIQTGGFGIMTGATLLGLLISRRVRLTQQLIAKAETKSLTLADVGSVVRLVLAVTVVVEVLVATILTLRLHLSYDMALAEAAWSGLFHSVSAFNNAGFSIYSDSLMRFALDGFILIPIMLAVVISGLGFPVLHELRREWHAPARWSIQAKLTIFGSMLLLVGGFFSFLLIESSNPQTLAAMSPWGRALNAMFHSVMTRTAGFNSVDIGTLQPESLFVSNMLMFIGGGSAGTAGGIKVTTFFLLGFVVWSEVRGHPDTSIFGRRVSSEVQRQALAVVILASGILSVATLALLALTSYPLDQVLFEVISAFATVGLSTGITGDLPPSAQIILIGLMYSGRVGTITLVISLTLRRHARLYRYPEERPIVG